MMRFSTWLVVMILFIATTGVFAAAPEWKIVPAESHLTFTATQNNAPITGEFKRFTGTIYFDRDVMAENQVDIIVEMGSLSTSYSDLTQTLVTPTWLSTNVFPKAEFKANRFKKIGDKAYQAEGTLTIRGKSAPIIVNFSEEKTTSTEKVSVKGMATLKRTAYGVGQGEWASTSEVKDDVVVNFILTAVKRSS